MVENIVWHEASVTKEQRQQKTNQKSAIFWFTGLSASGKSTLANAFNCALFDSNIASYVLDGDNIRHGLNNDLGFDEESRKENIRRIGEVAKLFVDSGQVVLTAFISPYIADRQTVRELVEADEFIEVYVKASVDACAKRDPKGLYEKAKRGEIPNFTGVSAPYEAPKQPEIIVDTEKYSIEQCVEQLMTYLKER